MTDNALLPLAKVVGQPVDPSVHVLGGDDGEAFLDVLLVDEVQGTGRFPSW